MLPPGLPAGVVLATFALLASSGAASADPLGPDDAGYRATTASGGFEDLRGLHRPLPLRADDTGVALPLGFTFPFYGQAHTSVVVTTEGYLTFGGPVTGTSQALPDPTLPNAVVAPFWADLDLTLGSTATIHAVTLGQAPRRRFVVQWSDVPLAADPASRLTFQAVLSEATGAVELRYASLVNGDGSRDLGPAGGGAAAIGIEDGSGTTGLLHSHRAPGAVRGGDAILFQPGPPPTRDLSLRSAVAAPGTEVVVSLDAGDGLRALRGLQGTIEVLPEQPGLPPVAVRGLESVFEPAVTNPSAATTGPLRFVLPVGLPGSGDEVPARPGGRLGGVRLVVPPDAVPGSSYALQLRTTRLAHPGPGDLEHGLTTGRLVVAAGGPSAEVDRLDLVCPPALQVGAGDLAWAVASGGGRPLPGVPVELVATHGALAVTPSRSVTGPDGRCAFTLEAGAAGPALLSLSSPGLSPVQRGLELLDPAAPLPAITSDPPVAASVGDLYAYQVLTAPAGAPVALLAGPEGMTIDAAGLVSWVPSGAQLGPQAVRLRAGEDGGQQSWTIVVAPAVSSTRPNQAPAFTTVPTLPLVEVGSTYVYDADASDPDGDPLTYSLDLAPEGLAMCPRTGMLTWTPTSVGQPRAILVVSDGRGGVHRQGIIFEVVPVPGDAPPVIVSEPPTAVVPDEPYVYQVVAEDPERQPLEFSLLSGPPGMTIDAGTGEIVWTPALEALLAPAAPSVPELVGVDLAGWSADDGASIGLPLATTNLYDCMGCHGMGSNWVTTRLRDRVVQTRHGEPTWFLGDLTASPGVVEITASVEQLPGGLVDADLIGVAIGYERGDNRDPAADYLLIDWLGDGGFSRIFNWIPWYFAGTPGGFNAWHVQGSPSLNELWFHHNDETTPPESGLSLVARGTPYGWQPRRLYRLRLEIDARRIRVYVDGQLELDVENRWLGRPIAFYTLSQAAVTFAAWRAPAPATAVGEGGPGEVVVQVRDPAGNLTTQTFTLGLVSAPEAEPAATEVDFGPVPIGQTVRQTVLLQSAGTGPVTLEEVQLDGPPGVFTARPVTVAGVAGAAIDFTPGEVAVVTSSIRLVTGAGEVRVGLRGEGVSPGAGQPIFVSSPPPLAIAGREYVYAPRAIDPLRTGLVFALESGPTGARVDPASGRLRWEPTVAQAGVHELVLTATDATGQAARQRFHLLTLAVTLEAEATPLRSPPGESDFRVTLTLGVTPEPARAGFAGEPGLELLHRLPVDGVVYRPGTADLEPHRRRSTPDGEELLWRLPLASGRIELDVRAIGLAPGEETALSQATEVRLLEAYGRAATGFELLGVMSAGSSDPQGIVVSPDGTEWLVVDPTADAVVRLDRDGPFDLRPTPAAATRARAVALVAGVPDERQLLADQATGRLVELDPAGAVSRTTRTDWLAPLDGFARDLLSGDGYAVSTGDDLLFHVHRLFGTHAGLEPPAAAVHGIARGEGGYWLLDRAALRVVQVDEQGRERSSFGIGGLSTEPEAIEVDPASGNLLVADVSRIYLPGFSFDLFFRRLLEYSPQGTLVRALPLSQFPIDATGVRRHPVTRDWLFTSRGGHVMRLGGQFGDTRPAPGPGTSGLAVDRASGTRWVLDRDERLVRRFGGDGTYQGSFAVDSAGAEGLRHDPTTGRLLVLDQSQLSQFSFRRRLLEYTPDGQLASATRLPQSAATAVGAVRDPATGELVLALPTPPGDVGSGWIVRVGPQYGRHVPLPSGDVTGVARDPATGELFVVDRTTRTVHRLDPAGLPLDAFSIAAWSTSPRGLAWDAAAGHLLVVGNNRLVEVTRAGALVRSTLLTQFSRWGEFGSIEPEEGVLRDPLTGELLLGYGATLVRVGPGLGDTLPAPGTAPAGVARDPATGDLWVVDAAAQRIDRLDPTGAVTASFALPAGGAPVGLGFDPSTGNLLVARADNWLLEVSPAGAPVGTTYVGDLAPSLSGAVRLPTGELALADASAARVTIAGSQLGRHIAAPAPWPSGVAHDPATGDLWTVQHSDRQLRRIGSSGEVEAAFPLPAELGQLEGVTVDPVTGNLLVVGSTPALAELTPAGVLRRITRLDGLALQPRGVGRDPASGDLLLVDAQTRRVVRVGPQLGEHTGLPDTFPRGVARDPATGDLWVLGAAQRRLFRLDREGALLGGFPVGHKNGSLEGVTWDDGLLWVIDRPYVVRYRPDGTYVDALALDATTPNATGLARDPASGDLLLTDANTVRLVRLGAAFGRTEPAPAANGRALSRDPDSGDVWLLDATQGRVFRRSAAGQYQLAFSVAGQTGDPQGLHFDAGRGRILVNTSSQLLQYSPGGQFLGGTELTQLTGSSCTGVTRDPASGDLLLLGNDSRVHRIGAGFGEQDPLPTDSTTGLARDPASGELWLADARTDRILRLAPDGAVLGGFSAAGDPQAVAYDARRGEVLVGVGARVYAHAPDGTLRRSTRVDHHTNYILGLLSAPGGALALLRYDRDVTLLGEAVGDHIAQPAPTPQDLALDPATGGFWVVDWPQRRVFQLDAAGGQVATFWVGDRLGAPSGIALSSAEVHILDHDTRQVATYDRAGAHLRTLRLAIDFSPTGLDAVGAAWFVTGANDLAEVDPATGEVLRRASLAGLGGNVTDVTLAANGQDLAVVEWHTGRIHVLSRETLAAIETLSTRAVGSFTPTGLVFDGSDYRVLDYEERRLFRVPTAPAATALPLSAHLPNPVDLAPAATGDGFVVVDAAWTAQRLVEVGWDGAVRGSLSLRDWGANWPGGAVFDGDAYRVADAQRALFRIATAPLPRSSFPTGASDPSDLTPAADGQGVAVLDAGARRLLLFDATGQPRGAVPLGPAGTRAPGAVVFDGQDYLVCDTAEDLLLRVPPAGLPVQSFDLNPLGLTFPQDVCLAADGAHFVVVDPSGSAVTLTGDGVRVSAFSLREFGCLDPSGIVFDGDDYRVTDDAFDRLFAMAPGGLRPTSFPLPPEASTPNDIALAAGGQEIGVVDYATARLHRFDPAGAPLGSISTRAVGAVAPYGLAFDGQDYRVADLSLGRIYALPPGGLAVEQVVLPSTTYDRVAGVGVAPDGQSLAVLARERQARPGWPTGGWVVAEVDRAGLVSHDVLVLAYGVLSPTDVLWDGEAYRVSDTVEDRVFRVAREGLPVGTVWLPPRLQNGSDLALSAAGQLLLVRGPELIELTREGVELGTISTAEVGCTVPVAAVFDGSNYLIADTADERLFELAPGGLSITTFATGSLGIGGLIDVTLAADGESLALLGSAGVAETTSAGVPLRVFSTFAFGCVDPQALAFDGTNYLVGDPRTDLLYEMAPGGLPVTTFATGAPVADDLALDPGTGELIVLGGTEVREFTAEGAPLTAYDTRSWGSFHPGALVLDADGHLRIPDRVEARLFQTARTSGFVRLDLGAMGVFRPSGVAPIPGSHRVLVVTDEALWEVCTLDGEPLTIRGEGAGEGDAGAPPPPVVTTLLPVVHDRTPLAPFGLVDPTDIGLHRSEAGLDIWLTDAALDQVVLLRRRDREGPAGRVLLLAGDGPVADVDRALRERGHAVEQVPLRPGALATHLRAAHSQVWIPSGAGPEVALLPADLDALARWAAAGDHGGLVVDGLAAARGAHCSEGEALLGNVADALEAAGGGLFLGGGPELAALADPADGRGPAVAVQNQLLAHLGCDPLRGAYTTPAADLVARGALFDAGYWAGILGDETVPGPALQHPAVPSGLQPGGAWLFPALEGTYAAAHASLDLPGQRVTLLSTTLGRLADRPDVAIPGLGVTAERVLAIEPAAGVTVPGGTARFALTLTNPRPEAGEFRLEVLGLPATIRAEVPWLLHLAPEQQVVIQAALATDASVAAGEHPFQVRFSQHAPDGRLLERGLEPAVLAVVPEVVPVQVALAAPARAPLGGALTLEVTLGNPLGLDALLAATLYLPPELGGGAVPVGPVVVPAGGQARLPVLLAGSTDPGRLVLVARAVALDAPALGPAFAQATVTVEAPDAPPVALARSPLLIPSPDGLPVPVALDGLASFDPEGAPLSYAWSGPTGALAGPTPSLSLPPGTHALTLVVSDGTRASAPAAVLVTVGDGTPPVIGPLADLEVEQAALAGTPVPFLPVVSDDAGVGFSVACQPAAGSVFPLGATEVVCTATDPSGNASAATFVVRVVDTTPPAFASGPGLVLHETTRPEGDLVWFDPPAASDRCDAAPEVRCEPAPGSLFPVGDTQVTCTATDASGNRASVTLTVRVATPSDQAAPTIAFAAPDEGALLASREVAVALVYADDEGGSGVDPTTLRVLADGEDVSALFAATAADGGATAVVAFAADGPHELRATVADRAGKTSAVAVRALTCDTTPPLLELVSPAVPVVVEQAGRDGTPVELVVRATDALDPAPVVAGAPPAVFALGTTEVTYLARDAAGNEAVLVVPVTVQDTTPPALPPLADVEVEQAAWAGTVVQLPVPTADDVCDAAPQVVCQPAAGSAFPLGETVVTCTATDASGNASQASFRVRVVDTTAPVVVSSSPDLVVEATGPAGAVVSYPPPAVADACDAAPAVHCAPSSGSTFPPGVTEVVCQAVDASGNARSFGFRVTVVDTTPPLLVAPADVTVEQATAAGTAVEYALPAAVDAVDPAPLVIASAAPGSVFPLGTTEVVLTAQDGAGNTARATFRVTVVDTTPPALAQPADVVVEQATAAGTAVLFPAPAAHDVCDAAPLVECVPPSGTVFPLGGTEVSCRARDASGNETRRSFLVHVVDTTPPQVVAPPPDLVLEATGPGGAVAGYPLPGVVDACDAAPALGCEPPPGALFPLGTTAVRCLAVDASGNEAAFGFTVTVVDTTPPVLEQPLDVTVEQATAAGTAVAYPVPLAVDLVDPAPEVDCTPPPGTVFPLGTTLVTCTARDRAGNASQVTLRVTVVDTTPPALEQPLDVTVEQAGTDGTAVAFPVPAAVDVCDAAPLVTCEPPSGTVFPLGDTTVVCLGRDASGNEARRTFVVRVEDTTPPALVGPPDLELTTPPGVPVLADDPEVLAWLALARATDVCDAAPVLLDDLPDRLEVGEERAVTFRAVDASGNVATCQATVRVLELRVTITAPGDGLCTAEDVTVRYETTGHPTRVVLEGTRTRGDQTVASGPGPRYDQEGDHRIEVRAETPRGAVSAFVGFSIDRTAPVAAIASPVARAHPEESYPLDGYRYPADFPLALAWTAHDEDGISGGVREVRLRLDGLELDPTPAALDGELFCRLALGLLGRHELELVATDCAGNASQARVAFEVVLVGEAGGGLLVVKPESLLSNDGVLTAFLTLPTAPTGCPLDPTFQDVLTDTLRLEGLDTGLVVAPESVLGDPEQGRLILKLRRDEVTTADGVIGTRFRLHGRFFTTTGPAFVADDEVMKNP